MLLAMGWAWVTAQEPGLSPLLSPSGKPELTVGSGKARGMSGRWTVHKHKPIQQPVACIRLWNSLSAEQAAVSLCLCPAVPSCAVAPVPLHVSTSCSQHSSTDKSQLPNSAATWIMPQLLKGLRPRCCRFTQCHSAQKQLQHNSGRGKMQHGGS